MNEIIYVGKHLITFSVSRHAHNSWEFIYCTGGAGRLSFDGGVLPYQAGDVVLIPPLIFHQNESEAGFTNIHLNMRDPALNLRQPTVVRDDANHFLLDAFTAAFYFFSSNPGKQTLLLSSYANLVVNLVADNLSSQTKNPIVDEIAKSIILNYPDENFELDTYLRSLPFNYDYLRKLFKSKAGITPHQLLSDIRLQAAAERLSYSEGSQVNVSEVAHLCGFRDPLYFSKIFRKKFSMTPSLYQRRQQEQPAAPDGDDLKLRPDA